jgi:hypothetical protein
MVRNIYGCLVPCYIRVFILRGLKSGFVFEMYTSSLLVTGDSLNKFV